MMNYEEFKQEVMDNIKDHLPERYADAQVQIQEVMKNNDERLDGLTILPSDSNISPNIYLNSYFEEYEDGRSMWGILEDIADVRMEFERDDFDTGIVTEWEQVKDKVLPHVCSAEQNEKRLSAMPHTTAEDLAVTYHVMLSENTIGSMTVPITDNLLEGCGVSLEELHEAAMENMNRDGNVVFMPMSQMLREMFMSDMPEGMSREEADGILDAMMPSEEDEKMYILTNASKSHGAAAVLNEDVRGMVAEQLDGDFFVLPSSVHECIIVPKDAGMDYHELESMVTDINSTQVAPQDRLSDHVYECDRDTLEFVRCDRVEERKSERINGEKAERADESDRNEKSKERPSLKERLENKKNEAHDAIKETAAMPGHKKEAVIA